jgi:hypothetical protein
MIVAWDLPSGVVEKVGRGDQLGIWLPIPLGSATSASFEDGWSSVIVGG